MKSLTALQKLFANLMINEDALFNKDKRGGPLDVSKLFAKGR